MVCSATPPLPKILLGLTKTAIHHRVVGTIGGEQHSKAGIRLRYFKQIGDHHLPSSSHQKATTYWEQQDTFGAESREGFCWMHWNHESSKVAESENSSLDIQSNTKEGRCLSSIQCFFAKAIQGGLWTRRGMFSTPCEKTTMTTFVTIHPTTNFFTTNHSSKVLSLLMLLFIGSAEYDHCLTLSLLLTDAFETWLI